MSPYVDHDPKDCGIDYKDADTLRTLYWEEGLSLTKIAERAGVSSNTIRYHMEKNDIQRRDRIDATKQSKRVEYAPFYTDAYGGYEKWSDVDKVRVHRLLAVAEFGFDAVCGMDVHHRDEIPWDNRPSNIELMEHGDHTIHHHAGKRSPRKLSEDDVKEIRSRIENGETDHHDLAEEYDVSYRTIIQVKNETVWPDLPTE
jgi:transposase